MATGTADQTIMPCPPHQIQTGRKRKNIGPKLSSGCKLPRSAVHFDGIRQKPVPGPAPGNAAGSEPDIVSGTRPVVKDSLASLSASEADWRHPKESAQQHLQVQRRHLVCGIDGNHSFSWEQGFYRLGGGR